MGPVAVLSALNTEIESLVGSMGEAEMVEIASLQGHAGSLDGHDVILVKAGLGKVNTATTVGLLWQQFLPGVFVFTGVAGGLDPGLHIGDVVVGARTIQHDAGIIEPGGLRRYQAGHHPFYNPTDAFGFSPSPKLLARVEERLMSLQLEPVMERVPQVVMGTILTGDQFLQDDTTRARLFEELGAAAVEMEGAALAQAAGIVGVDHLVIRSLSDFAGSDALTEAERFVHQVAANSARVVRHLLPVL